MSFNFYLASRYLLNHRQGAWGWLIGWMATGSVALGVAALIVTLSVMTGFREDIRQKILGVQPHILITSFHGTLDLSHPSIEKTLGEERAIVAWAPYVMGQVLIGHGSQSSGALLKGIDVQKELKIAPLNDKLTHGQWSDLTPPLSSDASKELTKPRIVLGQELARHIGARMGETVWLIAPGSMGLSAFSVPKAHLFVVSGVVQTGLYDYDSSLAYVGIHSAQKLFDLDNRVSGIGLKLFNTELSENMARRLQEKFEGAYWVRSWFSLNRNLFSALKLEKTVMFVILTLVTVVASFMIVSNLLLNITQKVKEIGILRAMGATNSTIHRVFLWQGFLMGIVGTLIGTALGIAMALFLAKTNFIHLPGDVYYIDHLPIRLEVLDIVLVMFAASFIVLIATLYPAHRATRVDPLEAIRYG